MNVQYFRQQLNQPNVTLIASKNNNFNRNIKKNTMKCVLSNIG